MLRSKETLRSHMSAHFFTSGYAQLWAKTDELPDRSFLAASFFVSFLSFFSCTMASRKHQSSVLKENQPGPALHANKQQTHPTGCSVFTAASFSDSVSSIWHGVDM